MKVLIIEDEEFLLKMYTKKFENSGFEVLTANNGADGIQNMKTGQPNIVLLDIMMPQMNGLQVLDAVKADESTKKIPVMMITNLSQAEDATVSLKKGAVDYIVKSDVTPAQLVEKVKAYLAK